MHHLDLQVIERALKWANEGLTVWLCTVLKTFGSSPRESGAMLVASSTGAYIGSLSGGCVEEDFIDRLQSGDFDKPVQQIRYGDGDSAASVRLPCGGSLEVLVEQLTPTAENLIHLEVMHATLLGRQPLTRCISLSDGRKRFNPSTLSEPAVTFDATSVNVRIGPALRLIIAGISSVTSPCLPNRSVLKSLSATPTMMLARISTCLAWKCKRYCLPFLSPRAAAMSIQQWSR